MQRLTPEQKAVRNEHPVDIATLQRELGQHVLEAAERDHTGRTFWEQNGGFSPEASALETEGRFAKYIYNHEFETYNRLEINEAFNRFNLDRMNQLSVDNMRKDERKLLAEHFVYFTQAAGHRARVLATPGADIERSFAAYNFDSGEQAIIYGHELAGFVREIQDLPAYQALEETIGYHDSRENLSKLSKKVRKYDEKHGKFEVAYDTQESRLVLWHEPKSVTGAA